VSNHITSQDCTYLNWSSAQLLVHLCGQQCCRTCTHIPYEIIIYQNTCQVIKEGVIALNRASKIEMHCNDAMGITRVMEGPDKTVSDNTRDKKRNTEHDNLAYFVF
jgi:hypothetical protein